MTAEIPPAQDRLYTASFFQVFAAVLLFMTGAALQFHFGQYFAYLGHDIGTLGYVAGLATVGTLLARLHIGHWIDRAGCRRTWIVGSLVCAVVAFSMQFTRSLVFIVGLRGLWQVAFAVVMTTVAVFAARIAPPHRRAESLGSLGLAGFTGMIIGPTLGDSIFAGETDVITPYRIFFTVSAVCALASGIVIFLAPSLRRTCSPMSRPQSGPSADRVGVVRLLLDNWPGAILLVGLAFSMVFSLQQMFLERLAEARGFKDIKLFFLAYAPTAISLRILGRRVPELFGRTRTLVGGLTLWGLGILLLVGIKRQVGLIPAGLVMGAGHCFIFPSMVDLAAEKMPPERRGMGTSIILGAGDLGLLLGYVTLGSLFGAYGFDTGLKLLASFVLGSTVIFAITRRRHLLPGGRSLESPVPFAPASTAETPAAGPDLDPR